MLKVIISGPSILCKFYYIMIDNEMGLIIINNEILDQYNIDFLEYIAEYNKFHHITTNLFDEKIDAGFKDLDLCKKFVTEFLLPQIIKGVINDEIYFK